MMSSSWKGRVFEKIRSIPNIDLYSAFFLFLYISYQNAWLSDDSFISFRTLDHFVNGYGLRWNIVERVQAFTNPLLVLVVSPFYYFYQNIVFWSFFSSFCWGLGTVYFLRKLAASKVVFWIGIVFLFSSKSFVDYLYSGLENSLNYLIQVVFFYFYWKESEEKSKLPTLVFLSALALVSRIDFILIFLIPTVIVLYKDWKQGRIDRKLIRFIFLSTLPALFWFTFSAVYYGSLFPNTYYSKTNVEDSIEKILSQGGHYYLFELKWDSIVFLFLPIVFLVRFLFRKETKQLGEAVLFSIPYLVYILFVGGDFMAGRFFTYVILLFGIAILRLRDLEKKEIYILGSFLIIYNILNFSTPMHSAKQQAKGNPWVLGKEEIADEKLWYYPGTGLAWYSKEQSLLPNIIQKKPFFPPTEEKVFIKYNTGLIGFFLPTQYIIDIVALGDPLLSRIKGKGRIGHKIRHLPLGYFESIETGENRIQDRDLKEYYDSIILLTRGDIFDPRRFNLFLKFQFGSERKYNGTYSIDEKREKEMRTEETKKKDQGIISL